MAVGCYVCGRRLVPNDPQVGIGGDVVCQACYEKHYPSGLPESSLPVRTSDPAPAADDSWRMVLSCCIGIICGAVGLYFLLVAPYVTEAETGIQVVNLQRLYIGQTFTLAGCIFLASALRPR